MKLFIRHLKALSINLKQKVQMANKIYFLVLKLYLKINHNGNSQQKIKLVCALDCCASWCSLCACDGLTKIHKSYGRGGCKYIYIYVGPYEIRLNFSQIHIFFHFNFSRFRFFRFHFMDYFLMIKLNCIYQKACLIN